MRMAVHELRALIFACLTMVGCFRTTMAVEPLLLVGQAAQEATFLSALANGELLFEVNDEERRFRLPEIVRWSTPHTNTTQSELLLTDGSRLVLADAWTGQPSWQMDGDTIFATTKLFGKVEIPSHQVRAISLQAPKRLRQCRLFLDQLLNDRKNGKQKSDIVRLTNGDHWEGRIVRIGKNRKGTRLIHLQLDSTNEPLQLPEKQVAAIRFGHPDQLLKQRKRLVVGLREGSLLMAESLETDVDQLRIRLAGGMELIGADRRVVAYLRSLTAACVYLSDLVAIDYQHEPYLEIPSPYHRDHNVLGGPLQAASRSYVKGLGMHTASRLTYSLDTTKGFERFVASVAVDDAAQRRGSVVFRVYLERNGEWKQAFVSSVVRSGDPPLPITVELGDATQLALVADFADRGDERDYANWLDARLE